MGNRESFTFTTMDAQLDTSMGNGGSDVAEVARQSKKDCRVYVGNLSYEVKSEDLSDFMRDGACER